MTIWKCINPRIKSDNPFKTQANKHNKKIRYCTRYHTGRKKGNKKIIGSNTKKISLRVMQ